MRIYLFSVLPVFAFLVPTQADSPIDAKQEKGSANASGNVERLWADLADPDAAKAYRAIWALTKTPKETVTYLAGKLKPAVAPDPRQVERLIEDLSSETFAVRDKANVALIKLGELVEPALKKSLKTIPSLEASQRIEKLLGRLIGPIKLPDHLRAVRAVETLEYIGATEAKTLLAKYAAGAPLARLTQDAKNAVDRMGQVEAFPWPPDPSGTDLYGDTLPTGTLGRLGTIRFRRPSDRLTGLAFLPDGKTLVTANGEYDVQLWDVASGRLLHSLRTNPVSIRGFALARGGNRFAVAGFHPRFADEIPVSEIRVFALPSGKLEATLPRKDEDVDHCALAFSSDGKLLFSHGSRGGFLRVEEVSSGKELAKRKFPSNIMGEMALSHDDQYVAVASGPNSRKLILWKWKGEEPRYLKTSERGPRWLSFSPDGKLLAAVDDYPGALHVWDVPSGRLRYQQEPSEVGYTYYLGPTFTPDGKTLAVTLNHRRGRGPEKTQLLDPATGRSHGILETSGHLAVSPDSRRLAVSAGCGVRIWDLASRTEVSARDEAHSSAPWYLIVSPKGFLVTGGEDNTVRLWDPASGKQRRKFVVDARVRAVDLSPNGKLLAASSFDDAVHVWDTATGKEVYRLAGHGELGGRRTLGFLPDSQGLLSWGDDFYLRLWDMKTGKARFEHAIRPKGVTIPKEDDGRGGMELFSLNMGGAGITSDGKTFVLDIGKHFHFFTTDTGKETLKLPSDGNFSSLAIASNNKYLLASAYGDYRVGRHPVSLLDISSGTIVQRLTLPGYSAGPVAFSADGRTFATAVDGPQGEILLYEVASGNERAMIHGFVGTVRSLAFFPDGRRLASGQSDSTALIWDLAAPEHTQKGP